MGKKNSTKYIKKGGTASIEIFGISDRRFEISDTKVKISDTKIEIPNKKIEISNIQIKIFDTNLENVPKMKLC